MKQIFLLFSLAISTFFIHDLTGEYVNLAGEKMTLNKDKSFLHFFQVGHIAYWQKGIWKEKDNILYLEPIMIYDTLRRKNMPDRLILSIDLKPDLHIYVDDETSYDNNELRKHQADINTTYRRYRIKNNKLTAIKFDGTLNTSEPKHELLMDDSPENYYDPSYVKVD
ncbi:hypothetical protein HYN48_13345 [Flavobacterium magnum]|uniref:Uncharacterized protein n=1 Tax=Flavobacterium magnum TaxID=2162713 RepID=A0A2S0RH90_9FLAO|nr:hypothetical protein [Flavobacterium magnum]AWA30985.1 hypothetical protein HYN48_13345 [Flavobacterium magnum]